ncbi:hypothetical protein CRYUN_Cryun02cG0005600 [Craigia yunnanensis]
MVTNCYWLLRKILDFTGSNIKDAVLLSESVKQDMPLYEDDNNLPSRRTDVNFSVYSAVTGKDLICQSDSRFEVWGTKGYNLHVRGRNKRLRGYHVIDLGRGLYSTFDTARSRRPKFTEKTEKNKSDSLGYRYLGLLYNDELDVPELVSSHWLVPAVVVVTGILLFLSIWRIRQKRRRRRRSGSGRLANL